MRTVEQIERELRAAREEEKHAADKRVRLEEEMKEIYQAAAKALGLNEINGRVA